MVMEKIRNLIRSQEAIINRRIAVDAWPVNLQMELTNRCNTHCIMCWRSFLESPDQEMSRDLVSKASAGFPFLYQLQPYLSGESLTYSAFADFLDGADDNVRIFLTTNLQTLNDSHVNALKKKRGVINVSLDAASEGVYAKIRKGSLPRVKENILRIKRETRFDIWLNMVVFKLNMKEVADFLDFAGFVGAKTVVLYGLKFPEKEGVQEQDPDVCPLDREDTLRLREIIRRRAYPFRILEFNNKITVVPRFYDFYTLWRKFRPGHLDEIVQHGCRRIRGNKLLCDKPWKQLAIKCDGEVRVCCEQRKSVGDLNSESLREIWNGDVLRGIRQDIVSQRIPEGCEKCHFLRSARNWVT